MCAASQLPGKGHTDSKLTWKKLTVDLQESSTWRSGVRSVMCATSQLPGKGHTDVDDAPAPAC